jgi:nucleotide-binding universal stress UspA family protein
MVATRHRAKIVVGVDGSPEADAALRVGYEEARLRGGELVVLHAWQYPPFGPGGNDRRAAEEPLARAVDKLRAEVAGSVPITTRLVAGDARRALVAEAGDAALVVVGSRGLGGVSAAVLGSVGTYLLHHAPCPVEVVPPGVRAAEV